MDRSTRSAADSGQGSFVRWFTFVVGVPAGVGVLYLILQGPVQDETIKRYVQHPAEQAVIVIFFCCLAALLGKLLASLKERLAQSQELLPTWDGKPIPASQVTQLQQSLTLIWESVQNTCIGRRIANILNFVEHRGSAKDLDDQMRTLADNDAITLDASYSLMRFLIWAMPILGFLGTVLGITDAIAGLSPQELDLDPGKITNGLTKAFDATALALSLTLVAMYFNYLVERREHSLLESVDRYVDAELAHRFLRSHADNSETLVQGMQQLIDKQVTLWLGTMDKVEQQWSQAAGKQQDRLIGSFQQALEGALTRYGQRLADMEKKLLDRQQILIEGLTKLGAILKESGHEHQLCLARLTDTISLSVEMMSKVQTNEAQLLRQQETLNQNLTLLANSATFEQAVESLTAAIHLLTTRVNPIPPTARVLSMQQNAA